MNKILFSLLLSVISFSSIAKNLPNIITILVDDMGYGDVQAYQNNNKIPTPNINALAESGMRFTDAHSPSSVCTPTRYSIFTGQYAWRTRLKDGVLPPYGGPLIDDDRVTLPKMLKEKGYKTALFGKWHLGMGWATHNNTPLPNKPLGQNISFDVSVIDHSKPITSGPNKAGFDYYFGVDVPNFPPYAFIENNKVLGELTHSKPEKMYGKKGKMNKGWKLEDILPRLTTSAVSYIDEHANKKSTKPLFLYFSTTSPHTPIVPAKEFVGKSKAGPYGDFVFQTDHAVGQLVNALKRNNMLENTLIIFTSDNGSPARAGDKFIHGEQYHRPGTVTTMFDHNPNAPWRGMKAEIWEGGHRVPFIASWPSNIPKGKVSNEPIGSVDIFATIANLVNYDIPKTQAQDSTNLASLWLGDNVGIDAGKTRLKEALIHHSNDGSFAIRYGQWKLTPQSGSGGWKFIKSGRFNSGTEGQLYDLSVDPQEKNNLWQVKPEIVKKLQSLLKQYQDPNFNISTNSQN